MTEAPRMSDFADSAPLPASEPAPESPRAASARTALASHVAAKLCHDFISPSGAIVSGLDLLKDPSAQDMREEAMKLIEASARKLVSIVNFARVAFGAATSAERFDSRELKTLADGAYEHMRATLEWSTEVDTFEKPQARALLNLAYVGGGALPTGGVCTVSARADGDQLILTAESVGARARLKAEAITGLEGRELTEGLAGQWIQPHWLHEVVTDAGGRIDLSTGEDRVLIRVRMPR